MTGLQALDRVLRGEAEAGLEVPVGSVARTCLGLAAGYGLCMGTSGLFHPDGPEYRQLIASAGKVPALFGVTLGVTFPSLYVANVLFGARLRFGDLLRLVLAALAVLVAVLAALGPIVAFFTATTSSYPFVLLLNVAVFAGCGFLGMRALHQSLARVVTLQQQADAPNRRPAAAVFAVWTGLFGLVGAQTGWVLRPFIGNPDLPFTWFRPREGSFFDGVARAVRLAVVNEP